MPPKNRFRDLKGKEEWNGSSTIEGECIEVPYLMGVFWLHPIQNSFLHRSQLEIYRSIYPKGFLWSSEGDHFLSFAYNSS